MDISKKQGLAERALEEKSKLRRVMGLRDLVLFYTIAVVGLRWIPTASTLGPRAIFIWILAFICFFIPLALTVNELSSRYPEEGGIYAWVKRSFGGFHAFMAGWAYWTTNIFIFPGVLLFGASNVAHGIPQFSNLAASKTFLVAIAFFAILIAITLNIVGLNVGKWLHNAGGLLGTWLTAAILIVMGLVAWLKFGPATDFNLSTLNPRLSSVSDILLLSNIAFAFAGLESASSMSEEVRDPRRNFPRALLLSGLIITFIYIIGTVCVLVALPQDKTSKLAGIIDAVKVTGERVGGAGLAAGLGSLVALLLLIAEIGNLGAWMAAISRLPFVAGIDGFLPKTFTHIHPRWHTPYVALLVQGAAIALLLVLSLAGRKAEQAYGLLVSLGVIIYFIPYLYMFASLIALQKKLPADHIVRVPGGNAGVYIVGAAGLMMTALSIVLSCIPGRDVENRALFFATIFGSIGVTLSIGAVVYLVGKRRRQYEHDR